MHFSPEKFCRVQFPIGLDNGTKTLDEIAVSIVSEIESKCFNHFGDFLKYYNCPSINVIR